MGEHSPQSVGLGGDGDEIAAITDVEEEFGVILDYADAPRWRTAGDVFDSLLKALPEQERARSDLWERFSVALAAETGVDPCEIERDSSLLVDEPFWVQLASAPAIVWVIGLVGLILIVAVASL